MDEQGIELTHRNEHKAALVQPWMGHHQVRIGDRPIAVKQQVEIDRPGAGPVVLIPPKRPFYFAQDGQQPLGRHVGFKLYDTIEEPTVAQVGPVMNRLRFIEERDPGGAVIKDATLIENSVIRKMASVGPFAHIRPGSVIGREAKIGNFVEVKKSIVGAGTKASHLTYLGDAHIGKDVNIGAGTITCNYDGYRKHITTIRDNVFIGSDSQLIAPVTIGRRAYVGAGSTITKDVPADALSVSLTKQTNIEGWTRKRKSKLSMKKLK